MLHTLMRAYQNQKHVHYPFYVWMSQIAMELNASNSTLSDIQDARLLRFGVGLSRLEISESTTIKKTIPSFSVFCLIPVN